jgi:pyrroline-5-carboxylate reductase
VNASAKLRVKPSVKAIVFLGGGRITTALVAGLRRSGYRAAIVVHDRHPGKVQKLRREFGVIAEGDLRRAVASAGTLLIAVRPASVSDLLEAIGKLRKQTIVVSLAAGILLAEVRGQLGPLAKWVRAMPSPTCRTGLGLTALAFDRGTPARARKQARRFFARVGAVLEIPERQFDAFTVAYSASHGYHALATLLSAAMRLGLDRATALTAASHALGDAILSWRLGESSLNDLRKEAATPGGIAATVVATMDAAGYPRIVEHALLAGMARARLRPDKKGQPATRSS